ncbi:hypothetical protein AVEN_141906-1 [Araneus ventricosus]|uniref:Uncharacterized protein n=1 Tax=Araneus ventricosus TaxID=182803 RepID=A0A4Y2G839_ARAVE|nr:hypothetical protein AVEN_102280-1 [Araneus ventricosus]GBM49206.1 hypothetical protein AVEN_141906-1 [Araneus ventricosus]
MGRCIMLRDINELFHVNFSYGLGINKFLFITECSRIFDLFLIQRNDLENSLDRCTASQSRKQLNYATNDLWHLYSILSALEELKIKGDHLELFSNGEKRATTSHSRLFLALLGDVRRTAGKPTCDVTIEPFTHPEWICGKDGFSDRRIGKGGGIISMICQRFSKWR